MAFEDQNPNETIYSDPARGTISYATSAKLAINIQGVELSEDVLRINFTDSVSGTFDSETGTATIPITAGLQQGQQNQILGRLSPGTGVFEAFLIPDLPDQVVPQGGDSLMGQRASDGALVQIDVGNLPTGGGGEANLGNNIGALGEDVFAGKVGVTLEFHKIEGVNTLRTDLVGAPAHMEVGFDDTAQGNFVGRSLAGTGPPGFVAGNDALFKKSFQSGFTIIPVANPGRALTNADYKGHIELDATTADATITLPDATSLAEPIAPVDASDPWCWIRVASGANLNIITAAVSGRLRSSNGYNSHNSTADTVYLGLSQSDALNRTYALKLIGSLWVLDNYVRDSATDDLTFDGPLQTVTDATASVTLTNATHGGKSVFLTNAGAVTLAVGGLTGDGRGVEVHKATVAGDVTVTGGIGATTIAAGVGALVRVRPDGVYVS